MLVSQQLSTVSNVARMQKSENSQPIGAEVSEGHNEVGSMSAIKKAKT